MKISDYLVQETEKENELLHNPSFNVNIRLFTTNAKYKKIIMSIIEYMEFHLDSTYEDYDKPKGVSAPTLGFPFNIIVYKDDKTSTKICLNPKILNRSNGRIWLRYTCGCLVNKKQKPTFQVERAGSIDLEFVDLNGQTIIFKGIGKDQGGFLIQHEVDHTSGILGREEQKNDSNSSGNQRTG